MRRTRRRTKRRMRAGATALEVKYFGRKVTNGNVFSRELTQLPPHVQLQVDPNYLYTLIVHDPDAPGHNKIHPWLHWIVNNIRGDHLFGSYLAGGQVIFPYSPPSPPYGIHKYYFTLYRQEAGPFHGPTPRPNEFNLPVYISNNQLRKVAETYMRVGA
jgi:phosphatidylethanolamine-binding protein (PEBP) family uncharacterized protein